MSRSVAGSVYPWIKAACTKELKDLDKRTKYTCSQESLGLRGSSEVVMICWHFVLKSRHGKYVRLSGN
ncbi:hypothetical protein CEXT_194761 [Caerostris extrusa]|uniref:Uncharacterized protein n=1 Tax=Caerostris extrusa TaxID=172846 RepID=A0AAV4MB65_CAEEX|nr:hypothetical protein CEXT_194761 [Caerostris extrusa]